MNSKLEVTFLGTCGSCSYDNGSRTKYGVNTSCVAVKAGGETLIFDAGSGICGFSGLSEYQNETLHVFFSHYHMDHINGLLFFSPLFDTEKRIELYGSGNEKSDFYGIVESFLSPPLNPVGIDAFGSKYTFHQFAAGETIRLSDEVAVRTLGLYHPGSSMGYRVEYGGKAFCYCTDIELGRHADDAQLLEFMHNADLLVLDAFYDDKIISGWGHSSWRESAEWAKRAGAKKLALFHHKFEISDAEIDMIEEKAKKIFPNTFASADRMRVEL